MDKKNTTQLRSGERWFGVHPERSLSKSGMGSTLYTASSVLLQLVRVIVLSRILSPEVFGLMAIILFFQAFLAQFNSMGFVTTLIQKKVLTREQTNSVFWLNIVIGSLLFLVMVCIGPSLAEFYGNKVLQPISVCIGFSLLLSSAAVQHSALLLRHMEYVRLTAVQVSSEIMGLIVAVILALNGFGVWALVFQSLIAEIISILMLYVVVTWRPGWPSFGAGVREMVEFGLRATAGNFVNFMTQYSQALILSNLATFSEAGYFNRGQTLFQRPFAAIKQPIARVLLPALSSTQNDLDRFKTIYLRSNSCYGLVLIPLLASFLCFGDWIVVFTLGAQWQVAGVVVRWLAVAGVPLVLAGLIGQANTAFGRPARGLLVALFGLPILLLSIYHAAPYGAICVAKVFAVYNWILFIPSQWIQMVGFPLSIQMQIKEMLMRLLKIILLLTVMFGLRVLVEGYGLGSRILFVVFSIVLGWVLLILVYSLYSEGRSVLRFARSCLRFPRLHKIT